MTESLVSNSLPLVATNQGLLLDALGDSTRRAIFERLASGPLPVGELAKGLPVTRPAVSQHLKVLKQAGLVIDHAAGTRRLYRVNPDGVAALQSYFERFWAGTLESFKAVAEKTNPKEES